MKVFMQKSTTLDKLESLNAFSARYENGNAAHLKECIFYKYLRYVDFIGEQTIKCEYLRKGN